MLGLRKTSDKASPSQPGSLGLWVSTLSVMMTTQNTNWTAKRADTLGRETLQAHPHGKDED